VVFILAGVTAPSASFAVVTEPAAILVVVTAFSASFTVVTAPSARSTLSMLPSRILADVTASSASPRGDSSVPSPTNVTSVQTGSSA